MSQPGTQGALTDGELRPAVVVSVHETSVDLPGDRGAVWACIVIAADDAGVYYPALWFDECRLPAPGELGSIAWVDDGTWRGWRFHSPR